MKRLSEWLLEHEPIVQLAYRFAVLVLLALAADGLKEIKSYTGQTFYQAARLEGRLSDIDGRLIRIESDTSDIASNTERSGFR